MEFHLSGDVERSVGPTAKLFVDDPYLAETDATVLFAQGPYVILDRTLFYAESGGQHSDTGTLGGLRVIAATKKGGRRLVVERAGVDVPAVTIDTVFVHQLEAEAPFHRGDRVHLVLDWARRYRTMRYHTAAHFLYHAAHQVYDTAEDKLFTKGCSITDMAARLDFFGALGPEKVPLLESLTNSLIAAGPDIVMEPEAQTNDIQYWRCGDIVIPCGGTHVRSARELGLVAVKRSKKGATTTRLSASFIEDSSPS